MDTRYQFQPRYVKVYRWLRWRPWCVFIGVLHLIWWALKGAQIPVSERDIYPTRWSMIRSAWQCWKSIAHMEMNYLYTTEEVLDHLRNR